MANFTSIGLGMQSASATNVVVRNTSIAGGQLGVNVSEQRTDKLRHGIAAQCEHQRATSAAVFSRNGVMEISNSVITQSLIGLQADTGAYINVVNSVISFNETDEQGYNGLGIIYVNSNNTPFANNGLGGGAADHR